MRVLVHDGMRALQAQTTTNGPQVTSTRGTNLSGSMEGAGGIGGLLGRSHGYSAGNWSTHNYYHADGNGNVTYLVNSSQTLAARYRYDAYGNLLSIWESFYNLGTANTYRFSSKEVHLLTGLYYYGYRWYAPNVQRWVSSDPLGEPGFEYLRDSRKPLMMGEAVLQRANLYEFCYNSPEQFIDRFGLWVSAAVMTGIEHVASEAMRNCECPSCCRNAFLAGEATLHGGLIGAAVEAGVQGPAGAGSILFDGIFFLWDTYDLARDYHECMDRVSK